MLLNSLKKYSDNYGFVFHKLFLLELSNLLKNVKGHENELFSLINKQLSFIMALNTRVNDADSNEVLKYKSEQLFYSLHLSSKNFNIRFIITFHNNTIPVFLVAFFERSGKSSTDYSQYEEPAKNRYKEYLKEDFYE